MGTQYGTKWIDVGYSRELDQKISRDAEILVAAGATLDMLANSFASLVNPENTQLKRLFQEAGGINDHSSFSWRTVRKVAITLITYHCKTIDDLTPEFEGFDQLCTL